MKAKVKNNPVRNDVSVPDTVSNGASPKELYCPVCENFPKEHKREPFKIGQCPACGLFLQWPQPELTALTAARDKLFSQAMLQWENHEHRTLSRQAQDILKSYNKHTQGKEACLNGFGRQVLEVNCGLGHRLREFQRYGWDCQGLEVSMSAVDYCKACFITADQGWLHAYEPAPDKFDLVLFWDSFGQMPDPVKAVEKTADILKPDGLVYCRQSALVENEFDPGQLFYFDQELCRRVFMSHGFKLVEETKDNLGFEFWFALKKGTSHADKNA